MPEGYSSRRALRFKRNFQPITGCAEVIEDGQVDLRVRIRRDQEEVVPFLMLQDSAGDIDLLEVAG